MTADRTDTAPDVGLSLDRREIAALDKTRGMTALTLHVVVDAILATRLAAVEAAHARDLATMRERAEAAEAKVAAVEALADEWDRGPDEDMTLGYASDALRAALADRPAGGEGR